MNKINDDWKDEYYCAEVFVRVQYRHKILIRVEDGFDPEEVTLDYLKTCSMQDLTSDNNREHWQDNSDCDTEDDQFEIANLWDRGDDWDGCCLENGAVNVEDES